MKNKWKKEREIDSIMKKALASDMEPDDLLNQKIMNMWKENSDMNKTVKRKLLKETAMRISHRHSGEKRPLK